MKKQKKIQPAKRNTGSHLPFVLVGSFVAGVGVGLLLLCLFALVLTKLPVPLTLVKPFACVAAAAAAMASGLALACGLGRQKMLCGLACGVFYSLCLVAATVLTGQPLDPGGAGVTVLLALLLGGLTGGAAAALRTG